MKKNYCIICNKIKLKKGYYCRKCWKDILVLSKNLKGSDVQAIIGDLKVINKKNNQFVINSTPPLILKAPKWGDHLKKIKGVG